MGAKKVTEYIRLNKKDLVQTLVKKKTEDKMSNYNMIEFLKSEPYNYSLSEAYKLMKAADVYIAEIYKEWNINALECALNDLAEQKIKASKAFDRKLVLEITKEENKLKGLYTEKIEVSGALKINTIKLVEVKKKDE